MPNPIESRILAALFLAPMTEYSLSKSLDVTINQILVSCLGLKRKSYIKTEMLESGHGWIIFHELTESGSEKVQEMMGAM